MTVSTTQIRISYTGDGTSVNFPIPFPFYLSTDLLVLLAGSSIGSGYSVSGGNGSTGTLTMTTAPSSGVNLQVILNVPLTQLVNLVDGTAFPSATINQVNDRAVQAELRLQDQINRSIRAPDGDVSPTMLLPSAAVRAGLMLTFDGNGNILPAPQPVAGSVTQALIGGLLYPQTPAEIAAGMTPTATFYDESDWRRYGALTSNADNSAAGNTALLVSANGGNAAFVPPSASGYKITSNLNATLTSSMYGMGQASQILPKACDGIVFTNQGTFIGSRAFHDFAIVGTGTLAANSAIKALMTVASGNQINGVTFERLSVQGFQYAVYGYGYYRCTWSDCYFFNNANGFNFIEQSIKASLRNCSVIKSPVATHGDGSVALNCDQLGGVRPQDVTATGCFFYGHDLGVTFNNILYSALDNCDIDQTTSTCVVLTTVNGGCRVRNCWLDTNANAATTGILVSALGSANYDLIDIEANYIVCTQANAGSIGLSIGGGNQNAVVAQRNRITGFATGASNGGSTGFIFKFNSINVTGNAVFLNSLSTDNEIGPNVIQAAGTPLAFGSLTPAGLSYYARDSFTITLTGMTASVQGTVKWVADGHVVTLSIATAGISGTSNATTMTGTGLPQYLWPVTDQTTAFNLIDNNAAVASLGKGVIAAASGTITFSKDFAGTPFTGAGVKGLNGFNSVYSYS